MKICKDCACKNPDCFPTCMSDYTKQLEEENEGLKIQLEVMTNVAKFYKKGDKIATLLKLAFDNDFCLVTTDEWQEIDKFIGNVEDLIKWGDDREETVDE